MSWDSKLIDRAKEIIELYPQKGLLWGHFFI